MQILLGSGSERRKKMMEFFSIGFKQVKSDFDESSIPVKGLPQDYVMTIAKKKAETLAKQYPEETILTADTCVFVHNRLYTKPESEKQALELLSSLSGSPHKVYTGVCVAKNGKLFLDFAITTIYFIPLTEKQIEQYHKAFYFPDAAGGYNITGAGSIIIDRIEGCYYNILGFPLSTIQKLLNKAGVNLWDYLKRS